MKITATKDSLKAALDRVSGIVRSNPRSLDVLQCVRISTYSDRVYVEARSPKAAVRVVVSGASVVESGELLVNFDKVKDRISKIGSEATVSTSETSLLINSGNDLRLSITLNDVREFPDASWSYPDESYSIDTGEFLSLLAKSASTLKEVSALTPSFMQVKIDSNQWRMSTGAAHFVLPIKCNRNLSVSIPSGMLSSIAAFVKESGSDVVWLSQDGENLVVTVGDDQLQSMSLISPFPDTQPIIDKVRVASTNSLEIERKRLLSEISRAKSSMDESSAITLTINGTAVTNLTVGATSEVGDTYESTMPCVWSGSPRTLTFTYETLHSFLMMFECDIMDISVGDPIRSSLPAWYYEEGESVGILNQFR